MEPAQGAEAASKRKQGRPRPNTLECQIELEGNVFYDGDLIRGEVCLDAKEEGIYRNVLVLLLCRFIGRDPALAPRERCTTLHLSKYPLAAEMHVPQGLTKVPFEFAVPENVPPTFSSKWGDVCVFLVFMGRSSSQAAAFDCILVRCMRLVSFLLISPHLRVLFFQTTHTTGGVDGSLNTREPRRKGAHAPGNPRQEYFREEVAVLSSAWLCAHCASRAQVVSQRTGRARVLESRGEVEEFASMLEKQRCRGRGQWLMTLQVVWMWQVSSVY